MNRLVLLALVVLGLQDRSGAPPQPETLQRTPAEWVCAEPGTWKDWDADLEPPAALQPFLLRSIDAYRLGDMPRALEALWELLALAPDYPSALHQSGTIYFRLRRYEDAIVAFERYLVLAPQRVGDTRLLGHCYYTLGHYEQAREHYLRVVAVQPSSVEALRGLALAEMRMGNSKAALAGLARVLQLDPRHANAATWRAQILFDEERVEEALDAGLRARDLDPYEPRCWFLLSRIYFELERDDLAQQAELRYTELNRIAQQIRASEAQLLLNPRQPEVYQRLILLQRAAGDRHRVGGVLNRWLQVEPERLSTRIALLDLAEELRDRGMAQRVADSLRAAAGDSIPAWERLLRYHTSRQERVRQIEAEGQLARLRAK